MCEDIYDDGPITPPLLLNRCERCRFSSSILAKQVDMLLCVMDNKHHRSTDTCAEWLKSRDLRD